MMLVKLGSLVSITGGGTPDRSNNSYWNGDIPWVTVKDFKSIEIAGALEHITTDGLKGSASKLIPTGAIIVPTRMALGKAAINTKPVAINQDLKALQIIDADLVDRGFLFRFLLSKAAFFESQGKGATVKGITLDVLRELEVPLPPKPEQQRIAAILDKADSLRRKRHEAIRLADEFLRAVFVDMFGKKPKTKVLTDYCEFLAGFAFKSDQYVQPSDGVRLLRGINVGIGTFEWSDSAGYQAEATTGLDRYQLEKGDVVMAMDRPWISSGLKCAVVDQSVAGNYLVQRVARLRPKKTGSEMFVFNCLQGSDFKSHCRITETTIPHISPKDFATYPVPNVTTEELSTFARIANRVRCMCLRAIAAGDLADQLQASLQDGFFGHG